VSERRHGQLQRITDDHRGIGRREPIRIRAGGAEACDAPSAEELSVPAAAGTGGWQQELQETHDVAMVSPRALSTP
jgi:hypothetical protein